jgi:hypothetical protein
MTDGLDRAKYLPPKHKWKPGESGNPGGKPKGCMNLRTRILEKTKDGATLLAMLLDIMENDEDTGHRLTAIKILLERCWGKPVESVEHSGVDGQPIQILVNTGVPQPDPTDVALEQKLAERS